MILISIRIISAFALVVLAGLTTLDTARADGDAAGRQRVDRILTLDPAQGIIPVNQFLDLFIDRDRQNFDHSPPTGPFESSSQHVPNFGFEKGIVWLRLTVRLPSPSGHKWLIAVASPVLDHITLYRQNDAGELVEIGRGGDSEITQHTAFVDEDPVFEIFPTVGVDTTYFIRIASNGGIRVPVYVSTVRAYHLQDHQYGVLFGMLFGIIISFAVYALIVSFVSREQSYLWLGLFLLSLGIYLLEMRGVLQSVIGVPHPYFHNALIQVAAVFTITFGLRYSDSYLESRRFSPGLYSISQGLQLVSLAALLVSILEYRLGSQIIAWLSLVASFIVLAAGVVELKRSVRAAMFFLLGWSTLLVAIVLHIVRLLGWLADYPITDGLHILGSAIAAGFFLLSLGDKLRHMQHERQSMARNYAIQLEKTVDEKTAELSERNRQLGDAVSRLADAKEEAETASRTKSRFLANMSHELRTPLNAILGFAEIIREQIHGPASEKRYVEYAGDIHRAGEHLLNVINDILDVSKVEAGKQELEEEPTPIVEIVHDCISLIRHKASAGGVDIANEVREDLPRLLLDRRLMKQVLLNLLSNAVKFTPQGGRITISADMLSDGKLCLSVADTGIGIPADKMSLVLEPFGQVESDDKSRKFEGTGLGLPLSKSLVELHGGILTLESTVGAGTIVKAVLPNERILPPTA